MFRVQQNEFRTVSYWYDEREGIDDAPPYQRSGHIWSREDKALLIDSILNDFDMPKLYFVDFTLGFGAHLNNSKRQYAVVDGRQRLEAIFGFFENQFGLHRDFVLRSDPDLRLGGMTLRDLRANHPRLARKFENYNLPVMSVVTDEEGLINELFVRLNRSKPLTGAEVRNAVEGLVPDLIRELAEHEFFRERISFSTNRGQDRNAAGKLLLVEFRGALVDTKKSQLDGLVREANRVEAQESAYVRAAERVDHVLDDLREIFAPRDPLLRTQGIVTVYYWFVRSLESDFHPHVRAFLLDFAERRATNRAMVREFGLDEFPAASALVQYDSWSRNINDQASLTPMVEFLIREFAGFLGIQQGRVRVRARP